MSPFFNLNVPGDRRIKKILNDKTLVDNCRMQVLCFHRFRVYVMYMYMYVKRWFFISRLQPSKPDTGVYKRDWLGRANYLCSHCFLWPGTIKSWWKPSPGQTDQLHTLQHSPHTCIHRWREGTTGRYVLRP